MVRAPSAGNCWTTAPAAKRTSTPTLRAWWTAHPRTRRCPNRTQWTGETLPTTPTPSTTSKRNSTRPTPSLVHTVENFAYRLFFQAPPLLSLLLFFFSSAFKLPDTSFGKERKSQRLNHLDYYTLWCCFKCLTAVVNIMRDEVLFLAISLLFFFFY